jgi:hypothetical protein
VETAAVAWVHPFLAIAVVLGVALWSRPWLSLLASGLALSSSTAWMASANAVLGQLGLGWALLAVGHLILALLLQRIGSRRSAWTFHVPLFVVGWVIAVLSIIPPLLSFERSTFTYTLGNWIALNGWLAILAHGEEAPRLREFLAARSLPAVTFHWLSALPLPLWLGLAWTGQRLPGIELALVYSVVAWVLMFLGSAVRRAFWRYGMPWLIVAHLCVAVAVGVAASYYEQVWMAAVLVGAAAFCFTAARVMRWRWLLSAGGLIFPLGCCIGLDWIGVAEQQMWVLLAGIATLYVIGAGLLEHYRGAQRWFMQPLYTAALPVACVGFWWTLASLFGRPPSDVNLLWAALGQLLLGVGSGAYAWISDGRVWSHLAAWLGVVAGGLVAIAFSQGRGSSAAKAAVLAIIYIAAERGLLWAALSEKMQLAKRVFARRAWRLYRRALLVAGWVVSVGSILLAVVRNLFLLGGGRTRETWSVVGLVLVCNLYAVSSRLFRRPRFVWFASALAIVPWTLLTHLGWYIWPTPQTATYSLSWCILALILLLLGIWLSVRRRLGSWGRPLLTISNLVLPLALIWGAGDVQRFVSCQVV